MPNDGENGSNWVAVIRILCCCNRMLSPNDLGLVYCKNEQCKEYGKLRKLVLSVEDIKDHQT